MRKLLGGLALAMVLAGTASAIKVSPPRAMVYSLPSTSSTVVVGVTGMLRPAPRDVVLYPDGHPGTAVHPTRISNDAADRGPVALAIVYQGSSPEVARALGTALEQLDLARYLPEDSRVLVIDYAAQVETRSPWFDVHALSASQLQAHETGTGASLLAAVSDAVVELHRSPAPSKVLVVVGDGCDPSDDASRPASKILNQQMEESIDVNPITIGAASCAEQLTTSRTIRLPRPALLAETLRTKVFYGFMHNWYATFDVSSLGVLGTGDRDFAFDVKGSDLHYVGWSFPGSKVESWFSSRRHQIGLGALLVGLLAHVVRWRFYARRR